MKIDFDKETDKARDWIYRNYEDFKKDLKTDQGHETNSNRLTDFILTHIAYLAARLELFGKAIIQIQEALLKDQKSQNGKDQETCSMKDESCNANHVADTNN